MISVRHLWGRVGVAMDGEEETSIVIDEKDLTRRASARDVELAKEDFGRSLEDDSGDGSTLAKSLLKTTVQSEGKARVLLDLMEDALTRLMGGGHALKLDIDVLTHQKHDVAHVKLSAAAVELVASSMGVNGLPLKDVEDLVASRLVSEYELLLLRFHDTSHVSQPHLTLDLPSGRSLRAERARSYF